MASIKAKQRAKAVSWRASQVVTPPKGQSADVSYDLDQVMMVQSDTFERFGYGERVQAHVSPGGAKGAKNDVKDELARLEKEKEEYEKLKEQHEQLREKRGKDALHKAKGKRAAIGIEASLQLLAAREKAQREKGGLNKVNFTMMKKVRGCRTRVQHSSLALC